MLFGGTWHRSPSRMGANAIHVAFLGAMSSSRHRDTEPRRKRTLAKPELHGWRPAPTFLQLLYAWPRSCQDNKLRLIIHCTPSLEGAKHLRSILFKIGNWFPCKFVKTLPCKQTLVGFLADDLFDLILLDSINESWSGFLR